jgi:hypothetical protein
MPGILPHLAAVFILTYIGLRRYPDYFQGEEETCERYQLFFVVLICSFIPDSILAFHYLTGISSFDVLARFHSILHFLLMWASIILLLLLRYRIEPKRKPLWVMGSWAILLHVIMDIFIPDSGILF